MKWWPLFLIGCAPVTSERWGYPNFPGESPYSIKATGVSAAGIHFDASGQSIDSRVIDRLTAEVESCLGKPVDRSSFIVKIPSDWTLNCDGTQQVLRSLAPEAGCRAKGQLPDPKCPCRWRARIQWPNVIVTTPSMYLMKDALTRFVTGSRDPWGDPKLVACVRPTTDPLSRGTE